MGKQENHQEKSAAEIAWHEQDFYIDSGHWTSHPIFAGRDRHWLHYHLKKIRFYGHLARYLKKTPHWKKSKILLAPVGDGYDVELLQGMYSEVHGIDLSPRALAHCPGVIRTREGDILYNGYEAGSFDVVICVLFLHHVHEPGFAPFLKEFHRLLAEQGVVAVLEPCSLYPLSWVMSLLNRVMGNVTGKVEGERPVDPGRVLRDLEAAGFKNIVERGLGFTHPRFPCHLQYLVGLFDYPFTALPLVRRTAADMAWFGLKS